MCVDLDTPSARVPDDMCCVHECLRRWHPYCLRESVCAYSICCYCAKPVELRRRFCIFTAPPRTCSLTGSISRASVACGLILIIVLLLLLLIFWYFDADNPVATDSSRSRVWPIYELLIFPTIYYAAFPYSVYRS